MRAFRDPAQRGFTLLEVTIASALAVLVGLSVVGLVMAGRDSAATARRQAASTSSLRAASVAMAEDLSQSQTARLSIVELADKNHQVTFQRPVASAAGAVTWGAYDAKMPGGARLRANCSARYTVRKDGDARNLLRQVLADDGTVVREEILVRDVATGSAAKPGLAIVRTGDVYQVTIGLAGSSGTNGQAISFDVVLHN